MIYVKGKDKSLSAGWEPTVSLLAQLLPKAMESLTICGPWRNSGEVHTHRKSNLQSVT